MEKKSNHQANIVRLSGPRVHTNADTLELFDVPGTTYQVVVKKDQFKAGDLAVYIQPDSVVPQTEPFRFIWEPYATPEPVKVGPLGELKEGTWQTEIVPERRRRITVRKFRKEWSEGLLMPLTDFPQLTETTPQGNTYWTFDGNDVSDLLGIIHWEGESEVGNTGGDTASQPRRSHPKTLRGWFYFILCKLGVRSVKKQMNEELAFEVPKYDVEALKNFPDAFLSDEQVTVTEKIHGSQGRYTFREGEMYAGSRNFWKSPNSPCVWRKALVQNPWIEEYCRAHEGYTLYGEVTPTQKGFNYGCESGQVKFFVFDIRDDKDNYLPKIRVLQERELNTVPWLAQGEFGPDLFKLVDGPSKVPDARNAREGIVITASHDRNIRGLGRVHLKLVSNSFLEKDSK